MKSRNTQGPIRLPPLNISTTLFPQRATSSADNECPVTPTADELLASSPARRGGTPGAPVPPRERMDLCDTSMGDLADPPAPTERAQPDASWPNLVGFDVRDKIGGGGMGAVYRAFDRQLQVDVAIKVPKSLRPEAQAQFLNEAQRLAQVQHRNVVGIRKFDRSNGQVYFTMDLVRGPNAAKLIRAFGKIQAHARGADDILGAAGVERAAVPPELRRALDRRRPYYRIVAMWIAEAAEGLDAAHCKGILHRDVKPGNFLLAADGRLMVSDFGLARGGDEVPVMTGYGITGTLPYLSPERAIGDWSRVDQRADIWALGATLYEFLTYRRAYLQDGREVLKDIATTDPPRPRDEVRAIPEELERICQKALHRDPAQRYQRARDMADDLRIWADATPHRKLALAAVMVTAVLGILASIVAGIPPLRDAVQQRVEQWVRGTPPAMLVGISVQPELIVLDAGGPARPLADLLMVTGRWSDGHVTRVPADVCHFECEPATAGVLQVDGGALAPRGAGTASIRVSYADLGEARVRVDVRGLPPDHGPGIHRHPRPVPPAPPAATGPPRVLLVCSEQRNTDSREGPRPGGLVEERLREFLAAQAAEAAYSIVLPAHSPKPGSVDDALASAKELGARFVLSAEMRATPVSMTMFRDTAAVPVAVGGQGWFLAAVEHLAVGQRSEVRWEVQVSVRLLDVGGSVLALSSPRMFVLRMGSREFDGDEHAKLAREAWGEIRPALQRAVDEFRH